MHIIIIFSLLLQISGIISAETVNTDEAFYLGVCTVENRLDAGWNAYKVLNHYYAPFVQPTKDMLVVANSILNEGADCPPVYFVYSLQDVNYLFSAYEAYIIICESKNKCNIFMTKEQYRNARRR